MIKIEKGDGEVLIVVDCDGEKQEIMFSDVAKYWTTGQRQLVGGLGAFVQEPYVVCWVTHADGANGAVFIWDTKKKEIVHASEGSYVRKALLADVLARSRKLADLADIGSLGSLAACIGIHLRIEYHYINILSGCQHMIQSAKADVVCPSVSAEDPYRFLGEVIFLGKNCF